MPLYLDPKNDLTFKRVFGEHKHLCMSLLNSLLPLEKPIVSIEYQLDELLPEIEIPPLSIVDVRCTDSDGRQFIVVIQLYWTVSFRSRVLLNTSKAYVMQLDRAKKYELLQPVYSLNFVNEIFEKSPEMQSEYYHHYKLVNIKNTKRQIKGLEYVFVELPKFKPQNRIKRKMQELWLRFLTEINETASEAPKELLENSDTREALKYIEPGAYTKEQLFTYNKVRDGILIDCSVLSDYKQEGLQEGLSEGRKEAAASIALNLLNLGISLDDIVQSTGLMREEICTLQEKKEE